ncbi:MAG: hypothetical protein ACOC7R_02885 [Planctomycetota bacterium]
MRSVSRLVSIHLGLLVAAAAAVAAVAGTARADTDKGPTAGTLQEFRVEGQFFTTCISNGRRGVRVTDVDEARYIVLVCSATVPADGRIRTPDFTLRYQHEDDKWDRSRCTAVALSDEDDPNDLYDIGTYAIGDYASVAIDKGRRIFALAFYVEPDVSTVQLYRLGAAKPGVHPIGTQRRYSVFITTNGDIARSKKAQEIIEQGNYRVVRISDGLVNDQTGITIHYHKGAETQAREISQRLMIEFGKTPELKEMKLASDQDVVVWLGTK